MPIQPSPWADTLRPVLPRVRDCMMAPYATFDVRGVAVVKNDDSSEANENSLDEISRLSLKIPPTRWGDGRARLRYYKPLSHTGRSILVVHLIPLPPDMISPAVSILILSFVISSLVNSGGKSLCGLVGLPETRGDAQPWS